LHAPWRSEGDALFTSHVKQLAALTVQHAVPAIHQWREFAAAGGLMSYGANITETHRLVGAYVGRSIEGGMTMAWHPVTESAYAIKSLLSIPSITPPRLLPPYSH
jgi:hypothetical protein